MKKALLITLIVFSSFGWKTTVDSIKVRKMGSDSLVTVDSDDSLMKTVPIHYDRVTEYTYFPSYLLLDTTVTGAFGFRAKESDQGVYLGTGSAFYDPDSGAALGLYGYNYPAGLIGWATLNSAGNGRIGLNTPFVNFMWGDTSSSYLNIEPGPTYTEIHGMHGREISLGSGDALITDNGNSIVPESLTVTNGFSVGSSGDYFHGIEIIDDTNDTLQLIIGTDTFYVEVNKR